jgi:methyltransferase-like protein
MGEADFSEMQTETYPEPVTSALEHFAGTDVVVKEQYLDFIKGRRFRQTLLCRDEVVLDRRVGPERITELFVSSPARAGSRSPDLREGVPELFRGPRGSALETDCAAAKIALCRLSEIWPQALRFPELPPGSDTGRLAEVLLQGYRVGLLELHTLPPQFATAAGERPVASPLARLQVQDGPVVTTLRHTLVELDDAIDRRVLQLLDGTRNREALIEEVRGEEIELRLVRLAQEALLLR